MIQIFKTIYKRMHILFWCIFNCQPLKPNFVSDLICDFFVLDYFTLKLHNEILDDTKYRTLMKQIWEMCVSV